MATLLLAALFLSPLFKIGFIGDDIMGSYVNGWLGYEHGSLWNAYVIGVRHWLVSEGRFFPVGSAYGPILMHYFPSMFATKCIQVAGVLINIATAFALVRVLLRSWRIATVSSLVVLPTLQLRSWYDPIAGFLVLIPLALECVLLSALLWVLAFQRRDWRYALAAIAVYVVGLLTYEQTYALAIVNVYLAVRFGRDRFRLAALASTIVILIALVAFDLIMRSRAHTQDMHGTYSIAFTGGRYLWAIGVQLLGALPLSYAVFRLPSLMTLVTSATLQGVATTVLAGFVTFLATRAAFAERAPERRFLFDLTIVGILLWALPAAVIALSPRWQTEGGPGLAYINVYIEYFGVAFLITALCSSLWSLARWNAVQGATAFTAVFASVLYMTAQSNATTYRAWTPIYTNGRINIDRALRAGLIDNVPNGSKFLVDASYAFAIPESKYLFFDDAQKRIDLIPDSDVDKGNICLHGRFVSNTCEAPNLYQYRSMTYTTDPAWVQAARIRRLIALGGGRTDGLSDQIRIFATGAARVSVERLGARFIREAEHGSLYEYDDCMLVPLDIRAMETPHLIFESGWYGSEFDPTAGLFHWSQARSTLRVTNAATSVSEANIHAIVQSLRPTRVGVKGSDGRHLTFEATPQGVWITIPVVVPAAGTTTLTFVAKGERFKAPGDPRELAFRLDKPRLSEIRCGGSRR